MTSIDPRGAPRGFWRVLALEEFTDVQCVIVDHPMPSLAGYQIIEARKRRDSSFPNHRRIAKNSSREKSRTKNENPLCRSWRRAAGNGRKGVIAIASDTSITGRYGSLAGDFSSVSYALTPGESRCTTVEPLHSCAC